jgi:hypothetical protein
MLKIPVSFIHCKKIRDLKGMMSHMLIRHLLGATTEHYGATVITRGTMLNIQDFLKNCDIKGSKKKIDQKLTLGLNGLIKPDIIEWFNIEEGHILVTFNEAFLKEIYPEIPDIIFKTPNP